MCCHFSVGCPGIRTQEDRHSQSNICAQLWRRTPSGSSLDQMPSTAPKFQTLALTLKKETTKHPRPRISWTQPQSKKGQSGPSSACGLLAPRPMPHPSWPSSLDPALPAVPEHHTCSGGWARIWGPKRPKIRSLPSKCYPGTCQWGWTGTEGTESE